MSVSAIGPKDNSSLSTVVQTSVAGAVAGYASKYLLPVTKQENNLSKRTIVNYCRKVTNKAKMAEFNSLGDKKTVAQDEFIKLACSKNKDAFSFSNITERVENIGGEDSIAGKELRAIIRNVNEHSGEMTRRFSKAYRGMLKDIRPAVPFIAVGTGIGFFAGFAHNVLKTDYIA